MADPRYLEEERLVLEAKLRAVGNALTSGVMFTNAQFLDLLNRVLLLQQELAAASGDDTWYWMENL